MPPITGRTIIYPLVGHPVAQVRTPPAVNAYFAAAGIEAAMVPVDLRPEDAAGFFAMLRRLANCGGVSVTVPHKQAAFAVMDSVTARAASASAVNIVRRDPDGTLHGDMTDGLAFVAALRQGGFEPEGAAVGIAGAGGGAGSAIVDALCEAGIAALSIREPDRERRERLLLRVTAAHPELTVSDDGDFSRADLLVNASPLGMRADDPLPLDPTEAPAVRLCADVVTRPEKTRFLLQAEAAGIAIQTGNAMADCQLEFQMRHLGLWSGQQSAEAAGARP